MTTIRFTLPRTAEHVAKGRHVIHGLAVEATGDSGTADSITLASSELLANAADHGRGQKTHVLVAASDGTFRVEVRHERGENSPHLMQAGDDDCAGRGLSIVDAVATRWDVDEPPGSGHVTVWFEVKFR